MSIVVVVMTSETTAPSGPAQVRASALSDVLCFVVVALVTWTTCSYGLAVWIRGLADWDTGRTGDVLERLSTLYRAGTVAAVVPAVALASFAVRWRRAAGASSVIVGNVVLVLTLVVAAPGAFFPALRVLTEWEPARSGVMFCADPGSYDPEIPYARGMIVPFIGDSSLFPEGWVEADGRSLSRDTYSALYKEIVTAYGGEGDTFRLPDYRGMMGSHGVGYAANLNLKQTVDLEVSKELGFEPLEHIHWMMKVK